jgi:hypothetical protein
MHFSVSRAVSGLCEDAAAAVVEQDEVELLRAVLASLRRGPVMNEV